MWMVAAPSFFLPECVDLVLIYLVDQWFMLVDRCLERGIPTNSVHFCSFDVAVKRQDGKCEDIVRMWLRRLMLRCFEGWEQKHRQVDLP